MSMPKVPKGHLLRGIFVVATLMLFSPHAEGLRGCSSFGHSCFGAHGKRTDGGEDLAPSSSPEITDPRYPLNPRYDVNVRDSVDYGALNMNMPSASGKRIPLALLKILRNLANDMDDQSSADNK